MKRMMSLIAVLLCVLCALCMTGCNDIMIGPNHEEGGVVPGDFILKDGSVLSKDTELTADQKANVAAVIVRAKSGTTPALGVGIKQYTNGLYWCLSTADGYNKTITALIGNVTSGYMDGSDSWEKLKAACNDAAANPTNYPVFNYCLTYASTNGLTGDLATGWYLPTVAELYPIYQNRTAVDASLKKAGGDTFGASAWPISCCQSSMSASNAMRLVFDLNGQAKDTGKASYSFCVCAVRAFN